MEVIVDFLLEYYVWVLVVLVILLITVIGFLVDIKRKKKLRESVDNIENKQMSDMNLNNNMMMGTNMNVFEPNMNQNMNNMNPTINNMFNPNLNNFDVNTNNNLNGFEPNINNFNNNFNNNMQNQNIDMMSQNNDVMNQNVNLSNNTNNINAETFFVPTSQPSQVFEPNSPVIPTPVETTPIFSSTPTPVVEPMPVQEESQNIMVNENNNIQSVPVVEAPSNIEGVQAQMPYVQQPNLNVNNTVVEPANMSGNPMGQNIPVAMPMTNQPVNMGMANMSLNQNINNNQEPTNMPYTNTNFNVSEVPSIMPQTMKTPEPTIMEIAQTMQTSNQAPVQLNSGVNMPNNAALNQMPNVQGVNLAEEKPIVNNQMPTNNDQWQL